MSEQATSTAELPSNGNAETPALSERKQGEPSMHRVKQLLASLYGPSPAAWIRGLKERPSSPAPQDEKSLEAQRDEAFIRGYQQCHEQGRADRDQAYRDGKEDGRAGLQAEIVFSERLAEIRQKYPHFDSAWRAVRPLLPHVVWEEATDLENGLEGLYALSRLPELCRELSSLEPEQARLRFRFFIRDMKHLEGAK